jgi:hypothetical protein
VILAELGWNRQENQPVLSEGIEVVLAGNQKNAFGPPPVRPFSRIEIGTMSDIECYQLFGVSEKLLTTLEEGRLKQADFHQSAKGRWHFYPLSSTAPWELVLALDDFVEISGSEVRRIRECNYRNTTNMAAINCIVCGEAYDESGVHPASGYERRWMPITTPHLPGVTSIWRSEAFNKDSLLLIQPGSSLRVVHRFPNRYGFHEAVIRWDGQSKLPSFEVLSAPTMEMMAVK